MPNGNANKTPLAVISQSGRTFTAASEEAMLALTASLGDVVVRTDLGIAYKLKTGDPSQLNSWQAIGTIDHGALTGLSDDDHTQYLNQTRGDARYYTKGQLDAQFSEKADAGHTHTKADIIDFDDADYDPAGAANAVQSNLESHTGNTNNPHNVTPEQISAIPSSEKGQINGVATLDGGGKVPTSQLPPLTITTVNVVDSEAEMLALEAEAGDVAIRTDEDKTYILRGSDPSTLADWQELVTPGRVTSVFGRMGSVVAADGDYDASQVSFTSGSGLTADRVGAALDELATDLGGKADNDHTHQLTSLEQVPSAMGQAGQVLAVNEAGDAMEFVDPPEGGGASPDEDGVTHIELADAGSLQIGPVNSGSTRGERTIDVQFSRASDDQVASADDAIILGGYNNQASINTASAYPGIPMIFGGHDNTADITSNDIVMLGCQNTSITGSAEPSEQAIVAIGTNSLTASNLYGGIVIGGYGLSISGETSGISSSVLIGGVSNAANQGTIIGGESNTTYANSAIVGGYFNTIDANASQSFIGGGITNTLSGKYSAILGGSNHQINTSHGFVAGGDRHTMSGQYGAIVGGTRNQVQQSFGFIGGGHSHVISATYSGIVAGYDHNITTPYAFIAGGVRNEVKGNYGGVVGGLENKVQAHYGFIGGGAYNHVSAQFSVAFGYRAKASHEGSFVWADRSNTGADVVTSANNQFVVRAAGGFHLQTGGTGIRVDEYPVAETAGVSTLTVIDGVVNTDAKTANTFRVDATSDFTLETPANGYDGQRLTWVIRQDNTGGWSITLGEGFRSNQIIELSADPNVTDYLEAIYNQVDSTWDVIAFSQGYGA